MSKAKPFPGVLLGATLWLALSAAGASAGEPGGVLDGGSFAYGFPVEIRKEAPFQELILPLELYQTVVRPDLEDCAVLHSGGKPVPHALRASRQTPSSQLSKPLPFFPIGASNMHEAGRVSLHFRKAPDGTILDLQSEGEPRARGRTVAYLLDASSVEDSYSAIQLKLDPAGAPGLVRAHLEGSQDLDAWSTLARAFSLGRLAHQGMTLERDQLEIRPGRYRYLRLTWEGDGEPLPLLEARVLLSKHEEPDLHQWMSLRTEVSQDPTPRYLLDTRGVMPVDRLHVRFPGTNVVVPVKVYSRGAEDRPWRYRAQSTIYRLMVEGTVLSGETVPLDGIIQDRYWKLEADPPSGRSMAPGEVEVALGWIPHRLVFLAQGTPPYTLAFGSGRIHVKPYPLQGLLEQAADRAGSRAVTASAELGPRVVLGGEEKLRPPPVPFPWKRWVLWGSLLAGVALMGWMAARLYRQLAVQDRTSSREQDPGP
jgi:hypothetical protein